MLISVYFLFDYIESVNEKLISQKIILRTSIHSARFPTRDFSKPRKVINLFEK